MAEPTITIQDILTEYGNYYRAGSQSVKDIRVKLFQPSVTEEFFGNQRRTTSTRLELANVTISRVLQAFQSTFTPIGDTKFTPQIIPLNAMKIDVSIKPHDVMESWLGFLAENAQKPKDTPLVKYWLENLIIPQFQEDLELLEIFHGIYVKPTEGVPNPAGSNMDGVKMKLRAPGVNTVTMGAVPVDSIEFVDYVEDFFKNIPELVRKNMKKVAMNSTLALRFTAGMRRKYNMGYAQASDLSKLMDFNATVVGLPSHDGNNVIWTTPEENKVFGNKNPGNQSTFDVQPEGRKVNALTDFHKGLGFWTNGLVFKSDISLV